MSIMENNYFFIDTHFHLDYLKAFSQEEVIEKARLANVLKMITVSVSKENFLELPKLAEKYDGVFASQGIHPHYANDFPLERIKELKASALSSKKVVAIGEIGLDYFYEHSPRNIQIKLFEKQLELAEDLNLPVIIHTREAEEDTIEVLKNFKGKGVIHSFTSNEKLLNFALEKDFYIGLNGIITFKKSNELRDRIKNISLNSLLLETDSPFLSPIPVRGKENGPYNIPHIAKFLSSFFNVEIEQLAKITTENSRQLFDI